ncbi:hypothetical protein LCGC14_2815880, partial [marine sediment metagenome]
MARIIQAQDLGARPSLRSGRRVVSDQSGQIKAQGLQNLAQTVSDIAEGMRAREDKLTYASAKSGFLTADLDARKVVEENDEYELWEEKYREKVKVALEAAMTKIKSKSDRKLFEMDNRLAIERGTLEIRAAARRREIDHKRANLDSDLETARGNALAADPGTRSDVLGNALDNIESARAEGIISDEDAAQRGRAFTVDVVEGSLVTMDPESRIAALKDPQGQAKQFLHADVRAKMLRTAEKENKATRIKADSQSAVDGIMEKNPEDRGGALVAARKISDPDVR